MLISDAKEMHSKMELDASKMERSAPTGTDKHSKMERSASTGAEKHLKMERSGSTGTEKHLKVERSGSTGAEKHLKIERSGSTEAHGETLTVSIHQRGGQVIEDELGKKLGKKLVVPYQHRLSSDRNYSEQESNKQQGMERSSRQIEQVPTAAAGNSALADSSSPIPMEIDSETGKKTPTQPVRSVDIETNTETENGLGHAGAEENLDVRKKNSLPGTGATRILRLLCKYCSRNFPSGRALGGHMRVHTSQRNYEASLAARTTTAIDGGVEKQLSMSTGVQGSQDSGSDHALSNTDHPPLYSKRSRTGGKEILTGRSRGRRSKKAATQQKEMTAKNVEAFETPVEQEQKDLVEQKEKDEIEQDQMDLVEQKEKDEVKQEEEQEEEAEEEKPDLVVVEETTVVKPEPEQSSSLDDDSNVEGVEEHDDNSNTEGADDDDPLSAQGVGHHICSVCHREFENRKQLSTHEKSHGLYALRSNPKRSRRFMDQDFNVEAALGAIVAKKNSSMFTNDGTMCACTECGKRFPSWKALFGHMRCHPERSYRGIQGPDDVKDKQEASSVDREQQRQQLKVSRKKEVSAAARAAQIGKSVESDSVSEAVGIGTGGVEVFELEGKASAGSDNTESDSESIETAYMNGDRQPSPSKGWNCTTGKRSKRSRQTVRSLQAVTKTVSSTGPATPAENGSMEHDIALGLMMLASNGGGKQSWSDGQMGFELGLLPRTPQENAADSSDDLDVGLLHSRKRKGKGKLYPADNASLCDENEEAGHDTAIGEVRISKIENSDGHMMSAEYPRSEDLPSELQQPLQSEGEVDGKERRLSMHSKDDSEEVVKGSRIKTKSHVCSFCQKVFLSGQALGGHKRGHRQKEGTSSEATSSTNNTSKQSAVAAQLHSDGGQGKIHRFGVIEETMTMELGRTESEEFTQPIPAERPMKEKFLDLNLPAPVNDDDMEIEAYYTPPADVLPAKELDFPSATGIIESSNFDAELERGQVKEFFPVSSRLEENKQNLDSSLRNVSCKNCDQSMTTTEACSSHETTYMYDVSNFRGDSYVSSEDGALSDQSRRMSPVLPLTLGIYGTAHRPFIPA